MAFWDALSINFEPIWSQIGSKIDPRIINFVTWVPGMPPGGPQGVPKGRPTGPSPIFRPRFWIHFWYQNLSVFDSIFSLDKKELRERMLIEFGYVLGGPTLRIYSIYNQNQWFFIFELVGLRERLCHQKAFKMSSKTFPKWVQKWGLKSRWLWKQVYTRLSRIYVGLLATSGVPMGGKKGGLKANKPNQTRLCPLAGAADFA